ncbi:MAG: tetratricopeptide repeat protein [Candidatus Omnitrophota bacterium]
MNKKRSSQITTSAWQKTVLVLLGLVLSLLLLEAGMRLGGFVLASVQQYGNLRSIKQKGAHRILCLGESTTQGKYPYLLEQVLNERNIGIRFSVIDQGKIGTNTTAILRRVESYLDEYHPDMVVAMMGVNDGGDYVPIETPTTSRGTLFIRSLRIYKLARFLWLRLTQAAPKEEKKQVVLESTDDEEKQFQAAEKSLKKAIELEPKNDNVYVSLGFLYQEHGKFLKEAEELFKKAIQLNPKNDNAYFQLGWLYREQNKFPQSEDMYKKAIEINPRNHAALEGLEGFYRFQGKFSEAEKLLKRLTELDPESNNAYIELGRFYRSHDKLPQAIDAFKKAVELDPVNDRIYDTLSLLYEESGKPELAKKYAKKMNAARLEYVGSMTVDNYRKLKEFLDAKGVRLVCVQYPVRHVEPLKRMFEIKDGLIFVDNEKVFKGALKKGGYQEYFVDIFGGEFGHCTQKGNQLLAQNIADAILREVFNK